MNANLAEALAASPAQVRRARLHAATLASRQVATAATAEEAIRAASSEHLERLAVACLQSELTTIEALCAARGDLLAQACSQAGVHQMALAPRDAWHMRYAGRRFQVIATHGQGLTLEVHDVETGCFVVASEPGNPDTPDDRFPLTMPEGDEVHHG